jgi:23S rRNA (adenine2503-C2)-methyltransferase
MSRPLRDLTYDQLRSTLAAECLPEIHARALWRVLMREPEEMTTTHPRFLPPLVRWLQQRFPSEWTATLPPVKKEINASDGLTTKWLVELHDSAQIETVLMAYDARHTACISTQVGCAMGCVFCATGQGGFTRHLSPAEIVDQVLLAKQRQPALRNLVLMGMGEPLHNYDSVMQALDIITDRRGINIGPSRIAISTVGVVPGIRRLADEQRPYHLALSLHAADDENRSKLIPVNRRWPLSELLDACRYYSEKTQRRIFIEWTLIAGENDTTEIAHRLVSLLEGIDVHINLIPLNPTAGYEGQATTTPSVHTFQRVILDKQIPCTIRQRRGIDVAAGCGQLAGAS